MKIKDMLQPIEEELRARIAILLLQKKALDVLPVPPLFKDLFDQLNGLEKCWNNREAVIDAEIQRIRLGREVAKE